MPNRPRKVQGDALGPVGPGAPGLARRCGGVGESLIDVSCEQNRIDVRQRPEYVSGKQLLEGAHRI